MGNASSSSKSQSTRVDYGFLTPHGIYTGQVDWNQHLVASLIIERKLAPFYRPLEDYDPSWDEEKVLANRKGHGDEVLSAEDAGGGREGGRHGKKGIQKDVGKPNEAQIYRDAMECPICFMYYPPNINYSRCCFQPICTECFVQIKRNEPTPTHLVSEPACCPYCQQENFGVTYNPPQWRTGLVSDSIRPDLPKSSSNASDSSRRKSLSADNPNVITIDQIRPDWEERLAAVKAAVARRANRRIIMRQVGDRLIPVGVTSSRTQLPEGITTVEDIEELMLMEAMRLSLLEAERANNASTSNNARSNRTPQPQQQSTPGRGQQQSDVIATVNHILASNSAANSARQSEDLQRRAANPTNNTSGGVLSAALASPLANATHLIATSHALPQAQLSPAAAEGDRARRVSSESARTTGVQLSQGRCH